MKHLPSQPSETSPAKHGFPFSSTRYTIIYLTLIFTWTCYLSVKWRMCVSSRSSYIWILLFLELLLALPDLFTLIEFTIRLVSKPRSLHPSSHNTFSTASSDGTVHVLVTLVNHNHCTDTKPSLMTQDRTCGESPDIVLKTVKAAASQTYPDQSYQVFVLDDARNDNLRQAIQQLDRNLRLTSPGRLPVVYLSRKRTTKSTHYKSGNIRFGLAKSFHSHNNSKYFAVLDADMVPKQT
jgi:cellulose synthase/poly-beta-1,6-N-acetylglucosamine synthase-like glycosyltransferase